MDVLLEKSIELQSWLIDIFLIIFKIISNMT